MKGILAESREKKSSSGGGGGGGGGSKSNMCGNSENIQHKMGF
jgi:hypothetical protein